ncbi:MAG TPA: FecR family protein [Bdellovibrionota bacterium]|nr:FecR family protein [Bdellovibrionota bacterium]
MSLFFLLCALSTSPAFAGEQVGTLTHVHGEVKIFSHPARQAPEGPPPHALFEGEHYSVKDAQVGDRVEKGNIVRTATGGRARVVFENGDQFVVHPGTAYRVTWAKDQPVGRAEVKLMYGKIRAVIENGGPRKDLTIKTKAVTMGVRGTDFFVAEGGPDGGTEITVLRGKVKVTPITIGKVVARAAELKPVEVAAGDTAEAALPPKGAAAPVKVTVTRATKEVLTAIQAGTEAAAATPPGDAAIAQRVQKLEKKALETTLKDIRKTDPKLFAQFSSTEPAQAAEELHRKQIESLLPAAPAAPAARKPRRTELEDLGGDAYDRYFKMEQ